MIFNKNTLHYLKKKLFFVNYYNFPVSLTLILTLFLFFSSARSRRSTKGKRRKTVQKSELGAENMLSMHLANE